MEALSFEGVLAQARRVLLARWPGLLAAAAGWAVLLWLTRDLSFRLMMIGDFAVPGPAAYGAVLLQTLLEAAAASVLIGVVVRTGQPRRSVRAVGMHLLAAGVTVFLAHVAYGWGGMVLAEFLAALIPVDDGQPGPLAYVAAFLPSIYQFGLFAFLGMALPAALERPVTPGTAAAVSLKLTEGRRFWLVVIAVVGSVAATAPAYALPMLAPGNALLIKPLLTLGQMLICFGIGVLYLELRRLRTAASAGPVAETFA